MLNYYDAIWCGHKWWIWYDLWIDIWIYTLMVYYMNNLLMNYYMKICIYVDDYYMNNLLMEYYMKVCIYVDDYYMNNLLRNYYMNCICWINLMNIYEIIMLELYVVVDVVVDVLRCCWCCQCCWCRRVVEVVRCCWISCWVHAYSYKVGGSGPVEY